MSSDAQVGGEEAKKLLGKSDCMVCAEGLTAAAMFSTQCCRANHVLKGHSLQDASWHHKPCLKAYKHAVQMSDSDDAVVECPAIGSKVASIISCQTA